MKEKKTLYIISAYAGRKGNKFFIEELQQIFVHLNLNHHLNYYIIAGDFNARHTSWSNLKNNERGISLQNWLFNNDLEYKIKFYHSVHHILEMSHT
jgi:hypothetical protein